MAIPTFAPDERPCDSGVCGDVNGVELFEGGDVDGNVDGDGEEVFD